MVVRRTSGSSGPEERQEWRRSLPLAIGTTPAGGQYGSVGQTPPSEVNDTLRPQSSNSAALSIRSSSPSPSASASHSPSQSTFPLRPPPPSAAHHRAATIASTSSRPTIRDRSVDASRATQDGEGRRSYSLSSEALVSTLPYANVGLSRHSLVLDRERARSRIRSASRDSRGAERRRLSIGTDDDEGTGAQEREEEDEGDESDFSWNDGASEEEEEEPRTLSKGKHRASPTELNPPPRYSSSSSSSGAEAGVSSKAPRISRESILLSPSEVDAPSPPSHPHHHHHSNGGPSSSRLRATSDSTIRPNMDHSRRARFPGSLSGSRHGAYESEIEGMPAKGGGSIKSALSENGDGGDEGEGARGGRRAKQLGVVKMEMIRKSLRGRKVWWVYAGVYLMSTITSLEGNTTPTVEPYYLSLFQAHSLLSSIAIVTNIAYAIGKPPMAKILDVFGRAEGLCVAALIYFVGFIMLSAAPNVETFAVARVLAALGGQGVQLVQQIIIADTSTLSNRALLTSTISLPWMITTWIGPILGSAFLNAGEVGYRLAYAIFGLLLPLVAFPLFIRLVREWASIKRRIATLYRRASASSPDGLENGTLSRKSSRISFEHGPGGHHHRDLSTHRFMFRKASSMELLGQVWNELDALGLAMLTIGCTLFLLPLSLAARQPESWANPWISISLLIGAATLALFARYEIRTASCPIIPEAMLRNRTILAGCALGFWHFVCQFTYESYFTSFLQVARYHSARDAQYISQSFIFAACIAAIIAGLLAKWSRRYKIWGIIGVIFHIIGAILMIRFRGLDNPTSELVFSQVIGGVGGGLTTIAAQLGVQSVVSHQEVGMATAVFLTITQIGGAVGGALAGGVWTTLLPSKLALYLPPEAHHEIPSIVNSLTYAMSFAPGTDVRKGINAAYVDVQRLLNILALLALFPALGAMWAMKDVKLMQEDQDRAARGEAGLTASTASVIVGREAVEDADIDAEEAEALLADGARTSASGKDSYDDRR